MLSLCAPAIIYVIFSITQVIIDLYKGLFNTALVKFFVMIMVTLLLNILCERGLGVVSWIIVFIPFILMTVIVTLLLYFFGLNATTGTINYNAANINNHSSNDPYTYYNPDTQNNNNYNTSTQKQNSQNNFNVQNSNTNIPPPPLYISSSPAYQSL
jgi:predicted membrane protein